MEAKVKNLGEAVRAKWSSRCTNAIRQSSKCSFNSCGGLPLLNCTDIFSNPPDKCNDPGIKITTATSVFRTAEGDKSER